MTCTAFAPGRTELAGNHVDHQNGVVLTSTLSLGISGEAQPNGEDVIRVESEGFDPVLIDLADDVWMQPCEAEFNATAGLVRGAAAMMAQAGVPVSGFDMKVTSTLPTGGGLSSSAAFELLMTRTVERLFASRDLGPLDHAKMTHVVECDYFGKKSGYMDQTAIAVGGINLIDFAHEIPQVTRIDQTFADAGWDVCLVDVGVDHSANVNLFASIPSEMWQVADLLGTMRTPRPMPHAGQPEDGLTLGQFDEGVLLSNADAVREQLGDRPFMRALHYYREVRLVRQRAKALHEGNMAEYARLTALSGSSSAQYLQNVTDFAAQQPAMAALAVVDAVLDQLSQQTKGPRGVARIHGGGFGGSLQIYIPHAQAGFFTMCVESVLGDDCVLRLELTKEGAWAR